MTVESTAMDDLASDERFDVGGVMMSRPFKINRLGHFGLYIADFEASDHFYGSLLGLHRTDVVPGENGATTDRARFYSYGSDHHSFVLIHKNTALARDDRYLSGVTLNQISFQVGTLDEVVNAHNLLKAQGHNIWRIGRDVPGSNWAVYFYDADRHTVELFYGIEQIGWNRRSKPLSLFGKYVTFEEPVLPMPSEHDEVLAGEAEGNVNSGTRWDDAGPAIYNVGGVMMPRPFRIIRGGPISIFTRDIDAAIHFYTGTMGMTLTEESRYDGHRIAYLRACGEHHLITLVPIELRAQLGLTESTTLFAQGLQVGSYRQLKDAVRYLEERGCRRIDLPPQLYVGIDYATHFVDPDGHLVQLYHYMEQIGWDGAPRRADQRPVAQTPWPDTIEAQSDSYMDRNFQGPIA